MMVKYEDNKVKNSCALASNCDEQNTHSSLVSSCSSWLL